MNATEKPYKNREEKLRHLLCLMLWCKEEGKNIFEYCLNDEFKKRMDDKWEKYKATLND